MKNFRNIHYASLLTFALLFFLQNCTQKETSAAAQETPEVAFYSVDDFQSVEKFDTHVHLRADADTIFINQAAEDNFFLLTINVNSPSSPPVEEQENMALHLVKAFPEQVAYATTFSIDHWNSDDWQKETLAYLKASFAKGAIAVKVWKNIGLELKDKNGEFVMIDDPRFDPIIDLLVENNIPMIGHLGEPKNTWLPIEEMTVGGDKSYFREHPQYHMYQHPEYPSYEDQINARDHMLEKHPDLIFIGAHLGSLEWSVDALAERLDKYPNMAVDMAERISHFQYQAVTDWQKIHDFFINYQDRLLYATDLRAGASDIVAQGLKDPAKVKKHAHDVWLRHWKFFTTDETMNVPKVEKEFKGLKLPQAVVDKIYRKNAQKWIPGLTETLKTEK